MQPKSRLAEPGGMTQMRCIFMAHPHDAPIHLQYCRQTVGKGLDLAPTLTVRPGAPVRVIVTRDLILEPYESPLP